MSEMIKHITAKRFYNLCNFRHEDKAYQAVVRDIMFYLVKDCQLSPLYQFLKYGVKIYDEINVFDVYNDGQYKIPPTTGWALHGLFQDITSYSATLGLNVFDIKNLDEFFLRFTRMVKNNYDEIKKAFADKYYFYVDLPHLAKNVKID